MNQEPMERPVEEQPTAYPTDLTEQEFLKFSMNVAKKMGTLRSQNLFVGMYAVYFAITTFAFVNNWMQTGEISFMMLGMLLLTVASAVLTFTLMPARVKKSAKATFALGNYNRYYGEVSLTPQAIVKNFGDETLVIPLNAQSVYVETRDCMAFSTTGVGRSIILPARCVTDEMAAAIRKVVFDPQCTIKRQVIARMQALATEPIEKQEFPKEPQTLRVLDYQYTPEEFSKLSFASAWRRYVSSFPGMSMLAVLLGLMLALLQENPWWFPIVSLVMIVGYLAILMLNAKISASRAMQIDVRTRVVVSDRGLDVSVIPSGARLRVIWNSIDRAVDNGAFVNFHHGGGQIVSIPKRCIADFDEFRAVVDQYMKK